jgi:hypothetical protein
MTKFVRKFVNWSGIVAIVGMLGLTFLLYNDSLSLGLGSEAVFAVVGFTAVVVVSYALWMLRSVWVQSLLISRISNSDRLLGFGILTTLFSFVGVSYLIVFMALF